MSTATYRVTPIGNRRVVMTENHTKLTDAEIEDVVKEIVGLQMLQKSTGFVTFRSQREILAKLSPADASAVGYQVTQRLELMKK